MLTQVTDITHKLWKLWSISNYFFRFVDSTSELSNNTQATAEFNNVLYVLDGAKYFAIAIGNFLFILNEILVI